MFQLLNPLWLFAAAALVIPIVLHLWNIRPGKVLKVGSVSLMAAASRKSSRSLKLLDVPLLLLRCLLLLLLALLLAVPVWQKKPETAKVKGWFLIPKEHFTIAYQRFKPTIDSLTKAGYAFHYFNPGFPQSDLKQILLHPKDSIKVSDNRQSVSYWDLIQELNTKVPAALPVYLFTPNQAGYFTGSKPQVALNLHWQTFLPADTTASWIARAWFTSAGNIRIAQGDSRPSGMAYTYTDVQMGKQANLPYIVTVNNGQATVSLKNSKQAATVVDTSAIRMAIYADNSASGAGYVKAALQAVGQFAHRKIFIKQYSSAASIPAGQAWLFWLSGKPVSSRLIQQSRNILLYEHGKTINASSWISNDSRFATAVQQGQPVGLYKLITAGNRTYPAVWQDGFGRPVLSLQQSANTKIYHFYSRFNPSWNDLVWRNDFPAWLLALVNGEALPVAETQDKRMLSQQQLMPEIISETYAVAVKTMKTNALMPYFWLALVIVFITERWLAHRTPKTVSL